MEGYLWPDVHNRLAAIVAELLAPQLASKYVARIELYTVEDQTPESEIGILYPDVEVLQLRVEEPAVQYAGGLYGLSLDYSQKPPLPDVSEEDMDWIKSREKK